jgi:hypothetical protein
MQILHKIKCRSLISFTSKRFLHFHFNQDRQRIYDVTMRRFRESLLPRKSNKYYTIVCVRARVCAYMQPYLSSMQRVRAIL